MAKAFLTPLSLVSMSSAPLVTSTSISLVQTAPSVACSVSAAKTQTFSAPVTVGNWVIVAAYGNTGTAGTVSGGGVTTWTKQASDYWNGAVGGEIWYGQVTSAASVVTYAPGGGSNFCGLAASEWAGILVATPVSSSVHTNANASPLVGLGSVVTAAGQLVVVSCSVASATLASPAAEPGLGWVNLGGCTNGGNLELQADYLLGPALATYTPAWAVSSATGGNMTGVVFNPSSTVAGAVILPGTLYFDTTLGQIGCYTAAGWIYSTSLAELTPLFAAASEATARQVADYPYLRMAYR